MKRFVNLFEEVTIKTKGLILIVEAFLAYVLIVMTALSFLDLFKLIIKIVQSDAINSYTLVQQVLAHALLIVIALELAMMLINHTPGSVLEVVLYAVAKKMLISSSTSTDLLIGAVAMAVIFAIDKYLLDSSCMGSLFSMKRTNLKQRIDDIDEKLVNMKEGVDLLDDKVSKSKE